MTTAEQRLALFLSKTSGGNASGIEQLTPDASTREYFRIGWKQGSAIACVYPEDSFEDIENYLDVTRLFRQCNLPVAEIYAGSPETGVIIQEDLGDLVLRNFLETAGAEIREKYLDEAIALIARIQQSTRTAFELGSVASRLKFDREKLGWELDFFKTHYFQSLRKKPLSDEFENDLQTEFSGLSAELEQFAAVLCHRDYHSANLMLDQTGKLRIIDHQDARIGSATYDLVSLLLDRVLEIPPTDWLRSKKEHFFSELDKAGLTRPDAEQFEHEFDLTAVQRCLKAIGTFSNQTANRGKTGYTQYIKPMFRIVLEACHRLDRFPALQTIIKKELN